MKSFFQRFVLVAVVAVSVVFPLAAGYATQEKQKEALVLRVICVDPKYCEAEYQKNLPKGYTITCIGCSKSLVEDVVIRDAFFYDLKRIQKLDPTVTKIVLIDHTTCKHYGSGDTPEAHRANLYKIAEILQKDERSKHLEIELDIHDMVTNTLIPVKLK